MTTKLTTLLAILLLSAVSILSHDGEKLQHCMRECTVKHPGDRAKLEECHRKCKEEHNFQDSTGGGGEGDDIPYYFGRERFKEWIRTQHGKVQVLERFDKLSDLLRGIASYRLSTLETDPLTFVVPNHWDAEILLFVARGNGMINLLLEDRRESHELRQGDIFRVPVGKIVYLFNKDKKEKLYLVKILKPISTPGQFKGPLEQIERVFGKQDKGVIFKASEAQIEKLSCKSSEGGTLWPFGGAQSQQKPFNLLKKRPSHKNQRGEHYKADESDYKQLRDLDIQISFVNITRGSMMAPFFNSWATSVSVVISGKGSVEIVCPNLASQQSKNERRQEQQHGEEQEQKQHYGEQGREQEHGQRYLSARSNLSPGTVVVTPAGHPSAWIASMGENLQVVCFEINARNNQRNWLAGNNNILKNLDSMAKELAYGTAEVDALFSTVRVNKRFI